MQASLVARLPLVSRSHWQPTHGKQPILLKKGTLGSGPSTHIMPGKTKKEGRSKTETTPNTATDTRPSRSVARVGLVIVVAPHLRHRAIMALPACMCWGHLLCLRVTEVLNLRPKDFNLEVGVVKVQALKRQKETDKVMDEAVVACVCKLMDEGFSVRRTKTREY
jgi:hypothetical protein